MNYPNYIFKDIYWTFTYEKFDNQEDFEKELESYHKEISLGKFPQNFSDIALENKEIVLQYLKWNDEEDDHDEPRFLLTADNDKSFTVGELLYKMHNEVCEELGDEDNCYFEGFMYGGDDDPEYEGIPLYFLMTGT